MELKVIINGQLVETITPKDLAVTLMPFLFRDAKYMSFDALIVGIKNFRNILIEHMKNLLSELPIATNNTVAMKRLVKMLGRWDKQLIRINDRNEALSWLYTTMLNLEGLAVIR